MRLVDVHLGGPTGYKDQPEIPERFARDFQMYVWEDGEAGGELRLGGPAPEGANDAVSETIISHGVWEVPETICLLSAFRAHPYATFVDLGAHIGWFSLLALQEDLYVRSYDANPRSLDLIAQSHELAPKPIHRLWLQQDVIDVLWEGIGQTNLPLIVKIDVEGAESHAVRGLRPYFERRQITHCLMEVSPVFAGYYGDLLGELFDLGYVGYVMPEKRSPPPVVKEVHAWLVQYGRRLDYLHRGSMKDWVNDQHQFDVLLFSPEARFG